MVISLADIVVVFPLFPIYEPYGKNVWLWTEIFGNTQRRFWPFFAIGSYILIGAKLTIRELIEEQRRRLDSANPAERLAAALLIRGELTKRLSKLDDREIGQLLDDQVGAMLNFFGPESIVCDAAVTRLRGHV